MRDIPGWPPEALEFLRELEADNDRDWFKANRSRYDEYLLAPTRRSATTCADVRRVARLPAVERHALPHRPPIKEHIGMTLGDERRGRLLRRAVARRPVRRRGAAPPGARPARPLPAGDRRRPHGARRADAGDRAARGRAGLELNEPELVRAPRGYPADHPRLDLLRRKRLTVSRRDELARLGAQARGGPAGRRRVRVGAAARAVAARARRAVAAAGARARGACGRAGRGRA